MKPLQDLTTLKPLKPKRTWILIADGARARIVVNESPGAGIEPVYPYVFAASSAPARDYGADKPGRTHSPGGARQTSYQPREDWHAFEKGKFATEIAQILNRQAEAHAFDQLVLVAPPKIMGILRAALKGPVGSRVVAEVVKDLTHLSDHELKPHLADVIRL